MTYNLDLINQAWYIACDECHDDIQGKDNRLALLYILDYCQRHRGTLLDDAAKELIERQDRTGLRP